jgi:hypothetical protein
VSQTIPFWVFNGLSVATTPVVFQELAARDDVALIAPDAIDVVSVMPEAAASPEPTSISRLTITRPTATVMARSLRTSSDSLAAVPIFGRSRRYHGDQT